MLRVAKLPQETHGGALVTVEADYVPSHPVKLREPSASVSYSTYDGLGRPRERALSADPA